MNKNTSIVIVVLAILLIGGFILYNGQQDKTLTSNTYNTSNNITEPNTQSIKNTNPSKSPSAPTAVTNAKASPTDTTVILSGTVTPNGAFTNYWYEYGTTSKFGNKTSNLSVGSGYDFMGAPAYITGLTKDTVYYFNLVAENQYGRVSGTPYSFQTTHGNPPPVGSAPNGETRPASQVSRTSANINGQVNPNRAATGYWFEYGPTANLGSTSAFVSVGDSTNYIQASLALSDLNPNTTYYFRLNAQNQFSTVNGKILNFKTTGPSASTAPSVTTGDASGITNSGATLVGRVNPNGTDTTYWFEYSTDSVLGSVLLQKTNAISVGSGSNTSSVRADISGLNSKTTYYFRIVADNNVGTTTGDKISFKTK